MTATLTSVEAVRALAPLIREHAAASESERRLQEPVVRALTEAGVFRACYALRAPPTIGSLEGHALGLSRTRAVRPLAPLGDDDRAMPSLLVARRSVSRHIA